MNYRIKELELELARLKKSQSQCQHTFGKTLYNPYHKNEEYITGGYRTQGIHMIYNTSYRKVEVKRWTRTCSKCGFQQHTEKFGSIVVKQEPSFN